MVNAPNTPPNGLIWLGTSYANWRLEQRDFAEAFRHYEWLVKELPTHPVASWAYYWQAVRALAAGDQTLAKEKAAALRRCFAGRPDFLWQWELDARAVLILSDNTIPDSHTLPYQDDFFETQLAKLEHDTRTFQ